MTKLKSIGFIAGVGLFTMGVYYVVKKRSFSEKLLGDYNVHHTNQPLTNLTEDDIKMIDPNQRIYHDLTVGYQKSKKRSH
ncbi:MAG: hypothetical protein PUB18_06380 [bacterium]|nr:hypothetical protein [bacterium]